MRFRELKVRKNPDCVVCGPRPSVTRLIDYEAFCGTSPGAGAAAPSGIVPTVHGHLPELTVEELKQLQDRGEKLVLVDVREPREWAISDLGDSVKIPLGTLPRESRQALEGRRDRRLLPHRRPQRQRRRVPARERLRKGPQPRRRHQQVGGADRQVPAAVLNRAMRRLGLVLLAAGLAGFLFASARKAHFDAAAAGEAVSSPPAAAVYRWETTRWLLVGMGVIGLVFTVLPGKRPS